MGKNFIFYFRKRVENKLYISEIYSRINFQRCDVTETLDLEEHTHTHAHTVFIAIL